MEKAYTRLKRLMERAMALKSALTLFEWDNETLAPRAAAPLTARVVGTLSGEYFSIITGGEMEEALRACREEPGLTQAEEANVRELEEERNKICRIPAGEYRAFAELTASAAQIWAGARRESDFLAFAPTLARIIEWQKRFAAYRADGRRLYDVMLEDFEPGFSIEVLDDFFGLLKAELAPFLQRVMREGRQIDDSFLRGDYPQEKQEQLARLLAEYEGFDFDRGVLAVSAHPFTTNLHNRDVRITTHYSDRVDSSIFSVIHEAGHGIYELGIADELTLTPAGQGASMGMHESQSRFYENIIGRSRAFWVPLYSRVQALFPERLGTVPLDCFAEAICRVEPGLIRTEADELSYSLHVLIRYELEKELIEGGMDVLELPRIWADRYEKYLGLRPRNDAEGVLQDIHWAQGAFGYFPSYALGSAFGAQLCRSLRQQLDLDALLETGQLGVVTAWLREKIHRFGRMKTSRQLLREATGEDFNPAYYVEYLKGRYGALYGIMD